MKRSGPPARRTPLQAKKNLERGTTPIAAKSRKTTARDQEYSRMRRTFLTANPRCEIRTDRCNGIATDVHHVVNRSQAPWLVNDTRNWAAACRNCHSFVTDNPAWAKAQLWTVGSMRFTPYTGGPSPTTGGYTRVRIGQDSPWWPVTDRGWIREHQLLALDAGWVEPGDGQHVHHRNHRRDDNRLANLRPVSPSEHGREHRTLDTEAMVALHDAGRNTVEIAAEVGTHPGNVSRRLRAEGRQPRGDVFPEPLAYLLDRALDLEVPGNDIPALLPGVSRVRVSRRVAERGAKVRQGRAASVGKAGRIETFLVELHDWIDAHQAEATVLGLHLPRTRDTEIRFGLVDP